ncbi:hypothetical protein LP100_06840 [Moraxella bovis]|uniref:hypothetical protein n=1 Tax=Moraxella bovis TaxID=476 RepID=UPI0022272944|nr:hypothetical protein [Moraxella bovis]UZA47376.1 hypothetical protein LP100_06840 [Moraxella bovis]
MWQIISSSQPNSPVVAGENGQLLTMLDACLIDGFNSQTASSYQDGVLTFGIFHGYIKNQYITISDNSGQANYRIKDVSDNQVVLYDKPNLQGVITTKITPLGWESIFGANDPLRRAYRSKNEKSTKTVLFLDMTYPENHGYHATNPARRAMITLCEDMTTLGVPINDYTASINNKLTNPNGSLFINQAKQYDKRHRVVRNQPTQWLVCGDDKLFFLFINFSPNGTVLKMNIFGDFVAIEGRECAGFWGNISNDDRALRNTDGLNDEQGILINGQTFNFNTYKHNRSGMGSVKYKEVLIAMPTYVVADNAIVGLVPYLYSFIQDIYRSKLENTWVEDIFLVKAGSAGVGGDGGTIWGVSRDWQA